MLGPRCGWYDADNGFRGLELVGRGGLRSVKVNGLVNEHGFMRVAY